LGLNALRTSGRQIVSFAIPSGPADPVATSNRMSSYPPEELCASHLTSPTSTYGTLP
jgi:hypothetical protein